MGTYREPTLGQELPQGHPGGQQTSKGRKSLNSNIKLRVLMHEVNQMFTTPSSAGHRQDTRYHMPILIPKGIIFTSRAILQKGKVRYTFIHLPLAHPARRKPRQDSRVGRKRL